MGLLTDPSAGQGRVTKALAQYHSKLSILLYLSGVIWFCLLAFAPLNANTYFSENALLPGLVLSEFKDEGSARQFYNELQYEMQNYDKTIPYPWLLAKFRQIGLDTYTHNFTLNYPLGKSQKKFVGKNVYGILRAARAASTEAMVMSIPYRPPANIHATTAPSIAIMLAFAKYANKGKYWSKDIIFLITEHEQLGVQAWLEAYYNVACGQEGILDHGDLQGRGGAIQAAINLEFHDLSIDEIDVKVEGLNGQLPNLDLFNLATRMCTKEGIAHTFKGRQNKNFRDSFEDWTYSFTTLLSMVFTQATGVPNGNHGLFHRFGIQALTLEGFTTKKNSHHTYDNFLSMGRILEGIFRSLNNLLERFHQSYFFYLLPSSLKFISIGLYMPAVCLLAGALFVKACGKWCQLQQNPLAAADSKENENKEKSDKGGDGDHASTKKSDKASDGDHASTEDLEDYDKKYINLMQIGTIWLVTHIIGIIIMNSPNNISKIGAEYGYNTEVSIYGGFLILSVIILTAPLFVTIRGCHKSMTVLHILVLLELATALICLSMYNFSLGFVTGVIYVPFVLSVNPNNCRLCSVVQKVLWSFVHPLVVLTVAILICTFLSFPGETLKENLVRGFVAARQAIVFGIVDSMIYSNWLYSIITCIIFPNWLCFWVVLFTRPNPKIDVPEIEAKKKND